MDELKLKKFSEHPSSVQFEKILVWIGKSRRCEGRSPNKFKDFLNLCEYSSVLPELSLKTDKLFWQHYEKALVNFELVEILRNHDLFKWSPSINPPLAIFVPGDEYSLYHAASTAMWGIKDDRHTLEKLVKRARPEMTKKLGDRLQTSQASLKPGEKQVAGSEILRDSEREGKISGGSKALESFAVYVLANVIRRPIMMIDCSSNSATPSERKDMEGLYLPLEESPSSCFKLPLILCHRNANFHPLVFQRRLDQENVFLLIKRDLNVLSVKYLHKHQNSELAIQQYLNVHERSVILEGDVTISILCCKVSLTSLPEHLNSINIHLRNCQEIFQDFITESNLQKGENQKMSLIRLPPNQVTHPFQHIDESSQTQVIANTNSKVKKNVKEENSSLTILPSNLAQLMNSSSSEIVGEKCKSHKQSFISGNNVCEAQNITTVQYPGKKCITLDCPNKRDPDIGKFCFACFQKITIAQSGYELISIQDEDQHRYVRVEGQPQGAHFNPGKHSVVQTSKEMSPQKHCTKAYPELKSIPLLSAGIDNESHRQHCSNGHPFDLQYNQSLEKLGEKNSNQTANVTHNLNQLNVHDNEISQLLNKTDLQDLTAKDRLPRQDDENVTNPKLYSPLSVSEGYVGLRPIDSTSCAVQQEIFSPTRVTSPHENQIPELGQAECLSRLSDGDLIEVSESPAVQCDIHKCASPVCLTFISSSEKLCEKCQAILITHSNHSRHSKNNEQCKGLRDDKTALNNQASTFSVDKLKEKVHSEKMKKVSLSDIGIKTRAIPKKYKKSLEMGVKSKLDMKRSAENGVIKDMETLPSSAQTGVHDNVISKQDVARNNSSPSLSRSTDSEFRLMFERLTDEQRQGMMKCQSSTCQNYGNKQKGGYCNSCFSMLSERKKHVVIFGPTEPG